MNFTTNTKPLSDALDLGIINSNISNFHKKSTVVQVTANKSELRINIESSSICTELLLKGSGDSEEPASLFISSALFKQLMSTIDSPTVTLEFVEGGLVIHSGKSKFTLPKLIDADDLSLTSPTVPEINPPEIDIDTSNWKFIKDNQMYAIAMSFIHPVYTKVWVGETGDVLVGDFDNSLFTHSKSGNLGNTCLLSDTIVNLFNSLPEGSKLCKLDRTYLVKYTSDSFSYVTEFTPMYEDDENVGSYQSDIFLTMMGHPDSYVKIKSSVLSKFLNQAEMLSSSSEDTIKLVFDGTTLALHDSNVDCKVDVESEGLDPFEVEFKTESLRKVFANYDDADIYISSMKQEDEVVGILIWDGNLTTLIAGVE